jgi:hypothetical protein
MALLQHHAKGSVLTILYTASLLWLAVELQAATAAAAIPLGSANSINTQQQRPLLQHRRALLQTQQPQQQQQGSLLVGSIRRPVLPLTATQTTQTTGEASPGRTVEGALDIAAASNSGLSSSSTIADFLPAAEDVPYRIIGGVEALRDR